MCRGSEISVANVARSARGQVLTWLAVDEIEASVCGDPDITVEGFKQHCSVRATLLLLRAALAFHARCVHANLSPATRN